MNTHDDAEANIPIYASIEEAGAQAQQLSSLNDLVAEPKKRTCVPRASALVCARGRVQERARAARGERGYRAPTGAHMLRPLPSYALQRPQTRKRTSLNG